MGKGRDSRKSPPMEKARGFERINWLRGKTHQFWREWRKSHYRFWIPIDPYPYISTKHINENQSLIKSIVEPLNPPTKRTPVIIGISMSIQIKRWLIRNISNTVSISVKLRPLTASVCWSSSRRNLRLPRNPQDSPVKTTKTSCNTEKCWKFIIRNGNKKYKKPWTYTLCISCRIRKKNGIHDKYTIGIHQKVLNISTSSKQVLEQQWPVYWDATQ